MNDQKLLQSPSAQQVPSSEDKGIDTFLQEVEKPTIPAMTAGFDAPPPGDAPSAPPPPPEPVYTPPSGGTAVFSDVEIDEPAQPGKDNTKPVFSDDYKKKTLRTYLELEEGGTAWLCCQFTKTTDPTPFKYSEQSKAMMLTALEPYMDVIIEALPAWVPVLLIYTGLKADQVMTAVKLINLNKANEAGKRDVQKMQAVAQTMKTEHQGERKNYVLYSDGYYRNDRAGIYVKRDEEGKQRLEKPSMADLETILAVKNNRHPDLICKAFDITEDDFARLGINITPQPVE